MSTKAEIHSEKSLIEFIGYSIVAHLAILIVFTVKAVFFPSEDILIQSALRVDMVALPDKIEAPQPKQEQVKPQEKVELPPKQKPPVAPKPDSPKLDKVALKKNQNKALERLKALQSIETLRNEAKEAPKPTKPVEYKGNVITKGDELTGLDKLQYDGYFSSLKAHVKENWLVPQWLAEGSFKAQVLVTFDQNGVLISKKIVISSGNEIFDAKALEAIERSVPFPLPPEKLQTLMKSEGILFNFP